MPPETRYARSGDVNIAYQVVGEGPIDLAIVPGFISHVDLWWTIPETTAFIRRLASFCRLILFDKRGTGLSDPVAGLSSLEERMEDLHAVLDAAGSERPALLGVSEGGPMSVLFAATYPDRVAALALYGTFPTGNPERAPAGLALYKGQVAERHHKLPQLPLVKRHDVDSQQQVGDGVGGDAVPDVFRAEHQPRDQAEPNRGR